MTVEAAWRQAAAILVESFGFPDAEARHRVALWRARQHSLEGQALEALLPSLSPEERAQRLLAWALQGGELEDDLRQGAAALGLGLD